MRVRVFCMVALLTGLMLLANGCAPREVPQPGGEILEADGAYVNALTWLQARYPGSAPEAGLEWVVEDVVVRGPTGEPLLGAAERKYTSTHWVADVSWAVVAPEFLQYRVTLKSPVQGWFWEGSVRGRGGQVVEETAMQQMTEQLASELATYFVMGSPTYISSGMSGTLELAESREMQRAHAWTFVFTFDSRHSGYGDTSGQIVLPAITPHRVVVSVEAMEVVEAVMDGTWDMLAQAFLDTDEADARRVAEDFVRSSPTFVFDGILATLQWVETRHLDSQNAWTFVFRFESANAGYGDRTGQMVAEVITPHEARIVVENGEVTSALMDGKWDMLAQRLVS